MMWQLVKEARPLCQYDIYLGAHVRRGFTCAHACLPQSVPVDGLNRIVAAHLPRGQERTTVSTICQ